MKPAADARCGRAHPRFSPPPRRDRHRSCPRRPPAAGHRPQWLFPALAGLLLLTAGCETRYPSLTCGLWTGNTFRTYREPAPNPALQIYRSTQPPDLLVTYDELAEGSSHVRRRAFYLEANRQRLRTGQKPHFVPLSRTNRLEPLAILTEAGTPPPRPGGTNLISTSATSPAVPKNPPPSAGATNAVPSPLTITAARDGWRLTITEPNGSRTAVELPTYPSPGGETLRVLVTPLAVVADTAIAASIVGIFVLAASAEAGVTISP